MAPNTDRPAAPPSLHSEFYPLVGAAADAAKIDLAYRSDYTSTTSKDACAYPRGMAGGKDSKNELRNAIVKYLRWLPRLVATPSLLGLALLVLVWTGEVPSAVEHSGAALAMTLFIAALFILVPPVVFLRNPTEYEKFNQAVELAAAELIDDVIARTGGSKRIEPLKPGPAPRQGAGSGRSSRLP